VAGEWVATPLPIEQCFQKEHEKLGKYFGSPIRLRTDGMKNLYSVYCKALHSLFTRVYGLYLCKCIIIYNVHFVIRNPV